MYASDAANARMVLSRSMSENERHIRMRCQNACESIIEVEVLADLMVMLSFFLTARMLVILSRELGKTSEPKLELGMLRSGMKE